ncbi:UreF-domain-containing protein [Mycena albidolilacea]|uniref:UreF-domain-containing protein n=1 Tax=Mycena albidolilacea TaxID=1033008 RepID=A0AAD7F707_9AGAR|nr:UreF-domain-containing protein [Mycena albidolilacea]
MDETYLLLLLSDSNLPTGSFVASSGLESFLKHGFGAAPLTQPSASLKLDTIATFIRDSLATYAPSALPFVSDAHTTVAQRRCAEIGQETALAVLDELDELYECMTLNHVARRASKAQGVALLSLYSKSFSRPPGSAFSDNDNEAMSDLVDAFKAMVRRGDRGAHGHLPVCWGVLCAALGLSLERTQHLHLYLHARSLLSAAVRLNSIGPYAAQQLLLHVVSAFVDTELQSCARRRTGVLSEDGSTQWDETQDGPVNTWPLGEILAARHDLQHSRIFNS